MIPAMPIALIAIVTILSIEIISRRRNTRSLAKYQKRQAFDKMMANANNEQAMADIEARSRKMEVNRKGKGMARKGRKGKEKEMEKQGRVERLREILAGGRMRRSRAGKVVGSDGYEAVDVTREWEERYKIEMDSWDFGGSGEW